MVRSDVRSVSTGDQRTGRTFINRDRYVPDIAPFHLLSNFDRILDKIGEGRTQLTWTATGTYGNGTPWRLTRQNRFANRFDVSFESIFEMWDWLFFIQDNRFTSVQFDRITMTSTVAEDFERLGRAAREAFLLVETPLLMDIEGLFAEYIDAAAIEERAASAGPAGGSDSSTGPRKARSASCSRSSAATCRRRPTSPRRRRCGAARSTCASSSAPGSSR